MRTHRCPARTQSGRCAVEGLPDVLLACVKHWNMLSASVQRELRSTAGMSTLSKPRRAALAAARDEWKERP